MEKIPLEVKQEVFRLLGQSMSVFASNFPKPPSRWQRLKWWLRIEKRPPPPPPIPAGSTIRIAKPRSYIGRIAK